MRHEANRSSREPGVYVYVYVRLSNHGLHYDQRLGADRAAELEQHNKNLEMTQGRISTGFRVSEASDNAAYWSIATTMRSDNKALSTVQDALGLGASKLDTAYTA